MAYPQSPLARQVGPTLAKTRHVTLGAEASLPTRFGNFRVFAFDCHIDGQEYGAVVHGDVRGKESVPVRLHSECFTGDIMGSLRCDCRDQLEAGLKYIADQPFGAVVYLRQEGRGIGLVNKIRAYALQDEGLDTVDANHKLGFDDDLRTYEVAADIVRLLGIKSVKLISNNPKKAEGLSTNGIPVVERIPHVMEPTEHNRDYLATKRDRSGHILPDDL
jgi:GTP cyclohydrolase II